MDKPTYDWGASVAISDPELIPDYLTGKPELMKETPDATVRFNSILVCRIVGGGLDAIACDHPSHGCHPRFAEDYAKVHQLMAKLKKASSGDCPKCAGAGWLLVHTPEARHTVLLSTIIGMWRGIPYRPRGLPFLQAGATMEAVLTGHEPADASSTPGQEGCSWPGSFLSGGPGEGNEGGEHG